MGAHSSKSSNPFSRPRAAKSNSKDLTILHIPKRPSAAATEDSAFFQMLPPELRRHVLMHAFGDRTLHIQLPACVCLRPDDCSPAIDGCTRNYSWEKKEWKKEEPWVIGVMGWLRCCHQAYLEGVEVLYATNTFHVSSKDVVDQTPVAHYLPTVHLASIRSLEWVIAPPWRWPPEKGLEVGHLRGFLQALPFALPNLQRLYSVYTEQVLVPIDMLISEGLGDRLRELEIGILATAFQARYIEGLGQGNSVRDVIPDVAEVTKISMHSRSRWAKAFRIDIRHTNGQEESYFMKVSVGDHAREALEGEFEGTAAIHAVTPGFCPKPIAWGSLENRPDAYFYLCKFYTFAEGIPDPASFCEKLARLHLTSVSPEGKFGFHCTTYNGDLPQDNTWHDSWEAFFANGLRHILKVREARAGPHEELGALLPDLFEKVIPRLLRPLETGGRKVKPSLVHGDLWYGNAAIINERTKEGIVFDPAAFWAHNEYELGNWRPARNQFARHGYFEHYLSLIPAAEPKEDFDDRNALYALRFDLHAAALFPGRPWFVQMAVGGIRRLVEKYPEGHTGEEDSSRSCGERGKRLAQSPVYTFSDRAV
ncbi:hypothetical protein VTK56DRAFT_8886 [Thermocarpiscus australiensis]